MGADGDHQEFRIRLDVLDVRRVLSVGTYYIVCLVPVEVQLSPAYACQVLSSWLQR